jgi:hypothetical protein
MSIPFFPQIIKSIRKLSLQSPLMLGGSSEFVEFMLYFVGASLALVVTGFVIKFAISSKL